MGYLLIVHIEKKRVTEVDETLQTIINYTKFGGLEYNWRKELPFYFVYLVNFFNAVIAASSPRSAAAWYQRMASCLFFSIPCPNS